MTCDGVNVGCTTSSEQLQFASGKVYHGRYKLAYPCHAVALCVSKFTRGRTQPLAGG